MTKEFIIGWYKNFTMNYETVICKQIIGQVFCGRKYMLLCFVKLLSKCAHNIFKIHVIAFT